ncbi:hypothetical protein AC579_4288 [Pseudocercospora musae]|uniref:Uncharacterized protein n=1 Tax=Pseudocercospora musae TaxID=113226 RepID=A0A139IB87_9PEZI|nr:hypothetical protein AC579_4288 [Pseudocercospora musae]
MPRAGRGEPLAKTGGAYKWTDDEYGTLHVLEVEYPNLSESELERLWHQLFQQHKLKGRNYNASKLHETWAYRHYDGRSSKWVRIARPNQKPNVGDATQHNAQEQVWFRNLRQSIRVAASALTPPIILPSPTAQVDAGTMCRCNSCQGTVQRRNGKRGDVNAPATNKGKARGVSAVKDGVSGAGIGKAKAWSGKGRSIKQQGDEQYDGPGPASRGSGSTRKRSIASARRATYAEFDDGEEEEENDDEGGSEVEEVEETADADEDGGYGEDDARVHRAMARATAHLTLASGQGSQVNTTEGPSTGTTAPDANGSEAVSRPTGPSSLRMSSRKASGHEPVVKQPTFKMADIEQARSSLRMVHCRYLFVEENKLRLQEGNVFVQQDSEVYRYGGQVMTIAPPTQQAGPFMVCDTKRCIGCKRSANKNIPSPTEGLPFVHLRQCIRDAISGRLLFSPQDICEYEPASPDQPLDLGNAVLVCPGLGPRVYRVVVCDIAGCPYCSQREADGAPL